jgi:hypothetical protein
LVLLGSHLVGNCYLGHKRFFIVVYPSATLSSDFAAPFLAVQVADCSCDQGSHMALPLLSGTDQVGYEYCPLAGHLARPFRFGWSPGCFNYTTEKGRLHSSIAFARSRTRSATFAPL